MSALENEDLENVPLVRMEDVQPSRIQDHQSRIQDHPSMIQDHPSIIQDHSSRTYDLIEIPRHLNDEILVIETCVINDIVYDNECIVNDDDDDDDSNIGSMISIQSEEVVEDESEPEMIVPEMIEDSSPSNSVLEPITRYQGLDVGEDGDKKAPSSWPTLEILPGGVIKKPEKCDDNPDIPNPYEAEEKPEEMMYACAKCPERFKFLFCLVKHVKWHEDEAKKQLPVVKPKSREEEECTHTKKRKIIHAKPHKKKIPKKTKS